MSLTNNLRCCFQSLLPQSPLHGLRPCHHHLPRSLAVVDQLLRPPNSPPRPLWLPCLAVAVAVAVAVARRWRRELLLLAVALNNSHYFLFTVLKMMVFILLCLLGISLAPHKGVALLLDSRLKSRHLPFPTGREFAGIRLWERR
jgi:hypothetical protein